MFVFLWAFISHWEFVDATLIVVLCSCFLLFISRESSRKNDNELMV